MMRRKLAPGWTRAAVMDKIRRYNNGARAVDPMGDNCLYQAEDGNRCAVGCFIPDGHAALTHEGNVRDVLREYPELRAHMPFTSVTDLVYFQRRHDACPSDESVHVSIQRWLDAHVDDGEAKV